MSDYDSVNRADDSEINNVYESDDDICRNSAIGTKKRKAEPQLRSQFRWLDLKGCRSWLALNKKNRASVKCTKCNLTLDAKKSTIITHGRSLSHMRQCGLKKPPSLSDFTIEKKNSVQERKIAKTELQFVACLARCNIPFDKASTLLKTIQESGKGSRWQEVRMSATKARDITVNVIGEGDTSETAELLKDHYFSICVDEGTDISKNKGLVIVVRFLHPVLHEIITRLWAFVSVFPDEPYSEEAPKAGSKKLFEIIKDSFESKGISLRNIFAICFDGCNTMIGERSGLKALLEQAVPHILCVQCPAHILSNCTKYALKELPSEVLTLLQKLHKLFKSSNKCKELDNIQQSLDMKRNKILRYVPTRWLSLEDTVNRVLQQWEALSELLNRLIDRQEAAGIEIWELMNHPDMKPYLYMLSHILGKMNALNKIFQRNGVVIHIIGEEVKKTYKYIVSSILDANYVKNADVNDIDIFKEDKYVRCIDMQLGDEVKNLLIIQGRKMRSFCVKSFNFVVALSLEMKERFKDFVFPLYDIATCFNPRNALSTKFHVEKEIFFENFLNYFNYLIGYDDDHFTTIRNEWDGIRSLKNKKDLVNFGIVEFWLKVAEMCPVLSAVVLIALCIPHANADPERQLSAVKHCKSRNRNRLMNVTLESALKAKEVAKLFNKNEVFQPSEKMIGLAAERKYYSGMKIL